MFYQRVAAVEYLPLIDTYENDKYKFDNQKIQEFIESDLSARTDLIIKQLQPVSDSQVKDNRPYDISQNIKLGSHFFDLLNHAGQLPQARRRISEAIRCVLEALNRNDISIDALDDPSKAQFFASALSCISVPETMSMVEYLQALQDQLCLLLPLPKELADILPASKMLDAAMLDLTVLLLTKSKENVISTTTLFYNPDDETDPFNVAPYLRDAAKLWKNNAQKKLELLTPGQKLLIPIMSTATNPYDNTAADGHFSAVVATKTDVGYRFCIFDSITTPDTYDNKEIVIGELIQCSGRHHISIFRENFQYNNDCGIHTYNFFKLCLSVPDDVIHDSIKMKGKFLEYVKEQYRNNDNAPFCDDTITYSRLLRLHFVVDCIRNGYSAGLRNDTQLYERLYGYDNGDKTTPNTEGGGSNCSLWHKIRLGIRILFASNTRQGQ